MSSLCGDLALQEFFLWRSCSTGHVHSCVSLVAFSLRRSSSKRTCSVTNGAFSLGHLGPMAMYCDDCGARFAEIYSSKAHVL